MVKKLIRQDFQCKKLIENPIYMHPWNGNLPQDLSSWFFVGQEIPETRENPESQKFSRNSHAGNSWDGKVRSHMGGREWEFSVEYPWLGHTPMLSVHASWIVQMLTIVRLYGTIILASRLSHATGCAWLLAVKCEYYSTPPRSPNVMITPTFVIDVLHCHHNHISPSKVCNSVNSLFTIITSVVSLKTPNDPSSPTHRTKAGCRRALTM